MGSIHLLGGLAEVIECTLSTYARTFINARAMYYARRAYRYRWSNYGSNIFRTTILGLGTAVDQRPSIVCCLALSRRRSRAYFLILAALVSKVEGNILPEQSNLFQCWSAAEPGLAAQFYQQVSFPAGLAQFVRFLANLLGEYTSHQTITNRFIAARAFDAATASAKASICARHYRTMVMSLSFFA